MKAFAATLLSATIFSTCVGAAEMPAEQAALIAAVEKARELYDAAGNDMAKGAARSGRAKAVCAALKKSKLKAKDWIGTITNLDANGDGLGILQVEIAPGVSVKTYNNSFSDIGSNTLIPPDSPVFAAASSLSEGTNVRFSGTFLQSQTDCILEASLTLSGSVEEPEYIFRFSAIAPVD